MCELEGERKITEVGFTCTFIKLVAFEKEVLKTPFEIIFKGRPNFTTSKLIEDATAPCRHSTIKIERTVIICLLRKEERELKREKRWVRTFTRKMKGNFL